MAAATCTISFASPSNSVTLVVSRSSHKHTTFKMSSVSKVVLQGTGYNPAIGPLSTDPRQQKPTSHQPATVSTIWTSLFDKQADSLEKSSEHENQYMIIDNNPVMTKYIGLPKEYENLNCESFVAGIIEGMLDISYFKCEVSAHTVPKDTCPNRTVYLIKLDDAVLAREARLDI
ncbi:hypothetical protein PMKS-002617 [Pichia membranifaciens]|uniref:Trafficking protein particle complex subunit n=1 Tax=Pichia membranifaciens TaxID=4926 RepID=A0A1Q2YHX4_9ASCO|nr:hypothetical protein PMKS-002617 [Pichia membranifaciens]